MFEIIIDAVPEAMKEVFRGKLLDVISQKSQGSPATEDNVTTVVIEMVPEPFKSSILEKFKEIGNFDIKVIDKIITKHGTENSSLTYILHDIQDKIGYLPIEALRAVSNKCDIKLSSVYNIVTFYETFRLTPPGDHHIKLCSGTACHLKDKSKISKQIENKINNSSTITIEKPLCLGCCDCAPVVEIDGTIYKGDEALTKVNSLT
jgi:NADH-quinone oxidoreductase subunit E